MLPRFSVGDRVRVIRPGPYNDRIGQVMEVIEGSLLAKYVVQFGRDCPRFFEFDLMKVLPQREEIGK